MSIFSSAKARIAARKLAEEQLYEMAVEEIQANNIRQGLWAKALIQSNGNAAAKANYIKLRVESLKAEADLQEYVAENLEKNAEKENVPKLMLEGKPQRQPIEIPTHLNPRDR